MIDYILGIDIGTSSCKATLFDANGCVISSGMSAYNVYYPRSGFVEQNPGEWWGSVITAARDAIEAGDINPDDIKAIGVDGQSWSAIVVDKDGQPLFENPIWMDTRAADICKELERNLGGRHIFDLCGNPLAPTYTTPKILWFKRHYADVFKRAYKVLQSNSFIVYKLTGKFSQDISQGYGLHFFNIRTGEWEADAAREMGVELSLMPDIIKCHDIVGGVAKEAAALTGIAEGTPVIAGGLDAACSTLGAGVINDGQTQMQGGQAGGMSIFLKDCLTHEKLITSFHVTSEGWLLQGGTVGGAGTLKWLKESMFTDLSFEEMSRLAESTQMGAGGVVFLPYMAGERSPIWDSMAKGLYFGLDYSKNRAHIIRATMEGVAFSLLHNIKTAEEANAFIKTMNAVGGASNSDVWMQIVADVSGKPIMVSQSGTASTLGAAMLAGVAVGIYADFNDAVNRAVKINRTFEPNFENHERYKKYFDMYIGLYQKTSSLMHSMYELGGAPG